jgi:hypothetical protein
MGPMNGWRLHWERQEWLRRRIADNEQRIAELQAEIDKLCFWQSGADVLRIAMTPPLPLKPKKRLLAVAA